MKKSIILYIIILLAMLNVSCVMNQNNEKQSNNINKEYIVQFKEGTSKDNIANLLDKHKIHDFEYLTSSESRGYILLISLKEKRSKIFNRLKNEKKIKNIDPNYTRGID